MIGIEAAVRPANLPLHRGSTWTTDAPYRETAAAVAHYQQQGVQTVEMEVAALYAVAQYCLKQAGALLAISDSLADDTWKPAFNPQQPEEHLTLALDAIVRYWS